MIFAVSVDAWVREIPKDRITLRYSRSEYACVTNSLSFLSRSNSKAFVLDEMNGLRTRKRVMGIVFIGGASFGFLEIAHPCRICSVKFC